jgi:hypothetical protein
MRVTLAAVTLVDCARRHCGNRLRIVAFRAQRTNANQGRVIYPSNANSADLVFPRNFQQWVHVGSAPNPNLLSGGKAGFRLKPWAMN